MFQTVDNNNNSAGETNHRQPSCVHLQRWPRLPSALTLERLIFFLIHCLLCIILFIIIYVRLEQFNQKQDYLLKIFRLKIHSTHLTSNVSQSTNSIRSATGSSILENCSSTTVIAPRRNQTTRCLQIRVGSETIENVFCPINGKWDNQVWFPIQQRQSSWTDFNRTWKEYRRGFGNVTNRIDFWIGNDNLYWLTHGYWCRLRIELTDWYNETRRATYELFEVANNSDDFRLKLKDYHGDIEPSNKMDHFSQWHNNARFATYDHFVTTKNCPEEFGGAGWWYHTSADCAHVQLNGQISTHSDGLVPLKRGILWYGWKSDPHYSFQRVTMSIQPRGRRPRPNSSSQ